jgi:hypothetical protein
MKRGFLSVDRNFHALQPSTPSTQMKTKCIISQELPLTIAGLPPKSGKSTKQGKVSKPKSAPKVIQKKTQTKSIPAEGLESQDDDEDSGLDLDNELDEEDAINELAEKSNQPEQTAEEEDVRLPILAQLIPG